KRRQGSEGFRRALACIDKEAAVDEAMCADGRPHTATDALGQCRNWKLGATSGDSQSLRDRQPQLRARAQANVLAWAGCDGDTIGACRFGRNFGEATGESQGTLGQRPVG